MPHLFHKAGNLQGTTQRGTAHTTRKIRHRLPKRDKDIFYPQTRCLFLHAIERLTLPETYMQTSHLRDYAMPFPWPSYPFQVSLQGPPSSSSLRIPSYRRYFPRHRFCQISSCRQIHISRPSSFALCCRHHGHLVRRGRWNRVFVLRDLSFRLRLRLLARHRRGRVRGLRLGVRRLVLEIRALVERELWIGNDVLLFKILIFSNVSLFALSRS